jgi:hypothetical protein
MGEYNTSSATSQIAINEVLKSLNDIIDDNSRDMETKHAAQCLLDQVASFKFICSVVIWNGILSKIDVSKMLQCSQSNINESLNVLSELVKFLSAARSDEGFNKYIRDAKALAAEVNVVAEFPVVRSRTKVRHFDYESPDEQIVIQKNCLGYNFI